MSLPVLFLRSLVFQTGYVVSTLVFSLVCLLFAWLLPAAKRDLFHTTWCRVILWWFALACGVRYRFEGLENIPPGPVVVLANHQSEWETIFLFRYLAPVCPILKKELLSIPFYGWAMRLQKPIAIDRSRPHEAGKSLLTQGLDRLGKGRSVIIFPEGTRTSVERGKPFSRGGAKLAVAAGVPVLPMAHNAGHCWPPRRFLRYPGTISVVIGEPIPSAGQDAGILTSEVEHWVRQHTVNPGADSSAG